MEHRVISRPRALTASNASAKEGAGGDQRSVFAQAVSHGHVGLDAVSGQEPGQRQIGRQHGGLRNGGLAQIVFGLGDSVGVGRVHEDELAERLAEQRGHHAIGFGKSFSHDRFGCAERLSMFTYCEPWPV
jgi:hypothetical protein